MSWDESFYSLLIPVRVPTNPCPVDSSPFLVDVILCPVEGSLRPVDVSPCPVDTSPYPVFIICSVQCAQPALHLPVYHGIFTGFFIL